MLIISLFMLFTKYMLLFTKLEGPVMVVAQEHQEKTKHMLSQ